MIGVEALSAESEPVPRIVSVEGVSIDQMESVTKGNSRMVIRLPLAKGSLLLYRKLFGPPCKTLRPLHFNLDVKETMLLRVHRAVRPSA